MVGAVTTLIVIVAVFLAYNANNGLPFGVSGDETGLRPLGGMSGSAEQKKEPPQKGKSKSAAPQKFRSGNALRKSVMNALMSSRPRRGRRDHDIGRCTSANQMAHFRGGGKRDPDVSAGLLAEAVDRLASECHGSLEPDDGGADRT